MLKINLKQLEAFVATAEFSSFTKASEELFLAQSTVSSHVGALESALGIRLIQRSARQRVMLTKEGELVYREAREILDRCQALQDLKNQTQGNKLFIGASSVPGQCLMPEIMSDFLSVCPDCHYVQLKGDSIRVHSYLEQGKANLGFVGIAANPREYHYHPIAEDRLVLITANKEPFQTLHRDGTSGLALLDMPMILREENSGTRLEMEQYLRRQQIDPEHLHVVAQIDNPEAIRSSVSRGLGVSIMSVLAARDYLRSGQLLSFELGDQGAFRKIYLTWRKDALLSTAEQRFLEFVKARPLVTASQ